MNRIILSSSVAVAALMWGCGSNECRVDDPNSCPGDQVCEIVQGQEKPACFAPVEVRGKVFDLGSNDGIAEARIAAVDVNGSAVGSIAITAENGSYTLRIPSERKDESGAPIGRKVTLRASAQDFQTFPSGLRIALPIDTGAAATDNEDEGGPWVVSGGPTEVGLVMLPEDQRGFPSISGTAQSPDTQRSVLVVAEAAGQPGHSAIADASGDFTVFNVPPGEWKVRAFSQGVNYTPAVVNVEAGKDLTDVALDRATTPAGKIDGTVQIVSASGATSVVLVVASTFNENLARGEVPPGLRTPAPGIAPNIDSTFTIEGVPDGDYVVLAAFENDGLVRDPNTQTAGTEIQRVTVSNGTANRQATFKITDAIQVVSPGAGDTLEYTSATPTFTWAKYPQTQAYNVYVFDTLGNEVWSAVNLTLGSSGNHSLEYAGPALQSGQLYQWRAVAIANGGQPISQTEDLKGVFRVE